MLVGLGAKDLGAFLAVPHWREAAAAASASAPGAVTYSLAGADFAPLVPGPSKVVCVGLNYRTHILEMGRDLPEHPTLFAKFADTLIGANDDIVKPGESDKWDWEVELAAVIGMPVRRASTKQAQAAIAGFTVLNDVTARDWQFRTREWLQGKVWDSSTPIGPFLVTPDELPGGTSPALGFRLLVDGETMQASSTSDLLFGPVALVEYISTIVRLNPGDIIATGTPGGVGHARTPPVFLAGGETVTAEIEHLGACVNKVVKEPPARIPDSRPTASRDGTPSRSRGPGRSLDSRANRHVIHATEECHVSTGGPPLGEVPAPPGYRGALLTRTLDDARRWAAEGTAVFRKALAGLDDEAMSAATVLPGWSRKHLVAHVAANADALGNLVQWARTGTETPMYASPGERAAEIERGAALAAGTLVDWAYVSAEMLAQAMDELAPGQWGSQVVTAQGRTVPAAEVPWMRAREVWVHAVDLGTATTFGDLPDDFLAALTEEIRLRRGLDALPGGPLPEVAAWLAGRPHALVGAPALGPWL
jgi:acylpyruvate hydrolase